MNLNKIQITVFCFQQNSEKHIDCPEILQLIDSPDISLQQTTVT